ncbi:OmpA family protein [Azospirillum soli]|uniref:OmpA family protein n=1 Tax=Azospirillum soli TaxID=1304799 RepID=UPI001FE42A44|nr:OmpA family protein [Azospirillum soli]MBP2313621.1 outer membrane protein OmpA-like peptidoglycan-associated protein [Azospirillum soli]
MALTGPALAQTTPLGPNPSECEIQAALLGTAGPDCPPVSMKRAAPATVAPPVPQPSVPPPVQAPARVPVPTPPAPVAAPTVELRAAFRINFDFNSARIRPESRAVLDRVGAVMTAKEAGDTRFRIVGHTDSVGGDAVNLALSQRRAKAVVDYLTEKHGIRRDRLDASGMGAREPLIPDDPKAAENRRVEIVNLGG